MSAIGGILHGDGRPCESSAPGSIDAIARRLTHRAADGLSTWRSGCVALLHGRTFTTPESTRERQPFVDEGAGLAITFDGRLDNRAELLAAIAGPAPDGDAELTLRVYQRFGDACVERLLGDFAFAIWIANDRRLFCARDALGMKPFCYRTSAATLSFASEAGALLAGGLPPIDEGMAAEHLVRQVTSKSDTLYRDIKRLPPAHTMSVDGRGVHLRCYWQPDLRAELRYRRHDDYVEHLRSLLVDAVKARLRTDAPVAISLSGGLDSSTLASLASTACRAHAVPAPRIDGFLLAVAGGDEDTPFFEQVIHALGIDGHRIAAEPLPPGLLAAEAARYLDVTSVPGAGMTDRVRVCVRERGGRVMLTGMGADEWLNSSPWAYADLVRHGRIATLVKRARVERTMYDFIGWPATIKASIWPLVPRPAGRLVRAMLRRGWAPEWLRADFASRVHLADRLARHEIALPSTSYERYENWHQSSSGAAVHELEMIERASAAAGIEQWYPYYDRRIVEFGLSLPGDERWRDGWSKPLLREAAAPYVPEHVLRRRSNASGGSLVFQALQREGGRELFTEMALARAGWIDGPAILERFDRMTRLFHSGDNGYLSLLGPLCSLLSMELWARAAVPVQCD